MNVWDIPLPPEPGFIKTGKPESSIKSEFIKADPEKEDDDFNDLHEYIDAQNLQSCESEPIDAPKVSFVLEKPTISFSIPDIVGGKYTHCVLNGWFQEPI